MNEEKFSVEREALRDYLVTKGSSLESFSTEIGAGPLEQVVGKLALMEELIQRAVTAARVSDFDQTVYLLGAGAKRVKDDIYSVVIEAVGGIAVFCGRSMTPNEVRFTDYVSQKYAGGERQCELILSK